MQTKSAAFASMVASNDLVVENLVTVGFADAPQYDDVTIAVGSINIQRSVTTDAPAQTRMITGYPAAQATIVLSGLLDITDASVDATSILNPYNPASPIYRDLVLDAPVTIKAGLWVGDAQPELLTMFVGLVDSYIVDPETGEVTLTCLDYRNRLRSVPSTFTTICDPMPVTQVIGGAGNSLFSTPTTPGLTNVYMVDLLLRQNGIYASPPARAGALWGQSMAGGGFPQIYNPASLPAYCDAFANDHAFTGAGGPATDADGLNVMVPGYWSGQVPQSTESFGGIFPFTVGNSVAAAPIIWGTGGGFFAEMMIETSGAYPSWVDVHAPVQPLLAVTINENTGTLNNTSYTFGWQLLAAGLGFPGITDPTPDAMTFQTQDGNQYPLTIEPGWHHFAVQVNFTSNTVARYRVYVDEVLVLDVNENVPTMAGVAGLSATTHNTSCAWPMEAYYLTGETAATPASYLTWAPTAVLDASLNRLHATIDVTASDPWVVIQDLAQSEYALAGFDELGIFRYVNRQTLRARASVRSFNSDASLKAMQMQAQKASAINRVQVPINAVTVGAFQPVWTGPGANAAVSLPARSGDYAQTVQLNEAITGLSTFIYYGLFPPAVTLPNGTVELVGPGTGQDGSGYRACRAIDGNGSAVTSGVVFTTYQTSPNNFYLDLRNNNSFPVYFVTPTGHGYLSGDVGKPLVLVGACPVFYGQSSASSAPTSDAADSGEVAGLNSAATPIATLPPANAQWVVDGAVESALTTTANQWVEDPTCAQGLAEDLLEDLVYPRPIFQGVTTIADPSLQLADRVTIVDPDASLMNDDAVIFGIATTISESDWSQALDLRAVAQPGYWVLDTYGHSELGLTTWV